MSQRPVSRASQSVDFVVETRGLAKRYGGRRGGGSVVAVDGVDLSVGRGEIYGFLGPNGAGKTTTLRMLLGLIRPTAGTVRVLGGTPGARETLARTGSMIEGPTFYPYLSGAANLHVLARYASVNDSRISAVLETVDLADRAKDKFATYSLGMKQRLGVAAALLKEPELVVLDEPTNGLDPAGMRDMRALIQQLGRDGTTVILSSHLLAEVQEICDRVGVIDRGRMLAENTVEELRAGSELVVTGSPSDVARATLASLDFVEQVRTVDGELRVQVAERHTAAVTRALVGAGVAVTQVRRDDRQLEDVFFEITKQPVSWASQAAHLERADHV